MTTPKMLKQGLQKKTVSNNHIYEKQAIQISNLGKELRASFQGDYHHEEPQIA